MKIALLFATLAVNLPAIAVAQTSTCQSIARSSDRLACYDKASPPSAASKPPAAAKSITLKGAEANQPQLVDLLAAENAKLDAKLKTICRGC
jgi:hypothetical protein